MPADGLARELTAPIVGSSHTANSADGAAAYDEDATTVWRTTGAAAPIAVLQLDLGAVVPVGMLALLPTADGVVVTPIVEWSVDGSAWTAVPVVGPLQPGAWNLVVIAESARYVRLVYVNPGDAPTLGGVAELAIFPIGVTPPTPAVGGA